MSTSTKTYYCCLLHPEQSVTVELRTNRKNTPLIHIILIVVSKAIRLVFELLSRPEATR
jgi:hypothetical protein